MSRRTTLSCLAAAGALLLTAGCERPTPGVTLSSGSDSVHKESTTWCFQEPDKDCENNPGIDRIGVLQVRDGDKVSVDVDAELADKGWYLVDADAQQRLNTIDKHHYPFTADFTNRPKAGIINLQVKATTAVEDNAKVRGFWRFQLVQKD